MNDLLRDKLSIIANDDLLIQAIRSVFNEAIEAERIAIKPDDGNTLIGEKYRAYEKTKQIIEKAFTDLESYRPGVKAIKSFRKEQ